MKLIKDNEPTSSDLISPEFNKEQDMLMLQEQMR